MKKFLAAGALALSLNLASCASTGGVPSATVDAYIAQATAATVKACGFLPTAETVGAILASFVPGGAAITTIIGQVAGAICATVSPKALRRGAGPPNVHGIPVHGVTKGGVHI